MSSNTTLKQIADELGLSAMTVSRAINNRSNVGKETRKRVLGAAKRLGYSPNHIARSLVSKKSFSIGVVIPEISHSFFPEVISGIEEVTYGKNYQLLLTQSAEDHEKEIKSIEMLRSKRVDGILVSCAQTTEDFSYYQEVIRSGLPFVFFDRCAEGIGASCVSVNDRQSSRGITQHLIDHGHKKIAHLMGPSKLSIGIERLEGFKEALRGSDLPINPKWIVESGFKEQGGYQAMEQILSLSPEDRPSALVAANDPVAIGAMEALAENGLSIPEDMAIVGFSDDIRSPLLPCPLTTVQQPGYQLGMKAAEKLMNVIDGKNGFIENIEVLTKNIYRASCGC
ncbi:MAG: LacI family DNA-binding transcriptional regulator [Balneolales bacterium]